MRASSVVLRNADSYAPPTPLYFWLKTFILLLFQNSFVPSVELPSTTYTLSHAFKGILEKIFSEFFRSFRVKRTSAILINQQ